MLSRLRRFYQRTPDDGEEKSLVMSKPASKSGAYSKDPQDGDPKKESDDMALNTVYGTVQVDPPPTSTLKHDGGYINPEALRQLHEGLDPAPLPGTVPKTPKKQDLPPVVNGHSLPGSDPPRDRRPGAVNPWERWTSNLVDFWRNRTGFEQKLLIVSVAFAVVIIGCVIGVVIVNHHVFSVSLQESRLCLTRECVRAAGELMANMDDSVDPCEDFYEFGCGGWEDQHPMPEGSSSWSTFQIVDEILSLKLHDLLATDIDGKESQPVTSAKTVYKACMDTSAWKEQGLTPLLDLIKSYGGLPMITKNWSAPEFDWKNLSSILRNQQGFNVLFDVQVQTDWKDNTKNTLYMDQPKLFIGRPYLLGNTSSPIMKMNVLNYFSSAARSLMEPEGLHLDAEMDVQLKEDLASMWDLMVKLANISTPSEERRDMWRMYNNMSIAELNNITNQKVDWLGYFQGVFQDTGVNITANQKVVVQEIEYIKKVMDIIESTTSRDLANYMVFHIVTSFGEEATTALQEQAIIFRRKLRTQGIGRASTRPWHDCTEKVNQLLGMALGSLYVKAHVPNSAVNGAKAMVGDLEVSFGEQLQNAAWMDESTYKQAKRKLDKIKKHVAYPGYLTNPNQLEEHYIGLPEMDQKGHFQNILSLNRYWTNKSLSELFLSPSRTEWPSIPAVVNAFYSPTQNSITFPAGILQPPFYRDNTMTSLNYGGIGSVIGHEITHGFDDTGRQSDENGNLREWGTKETETKYLERAMCFIKQYSSYSVPELTTANLTMKLNGINTLGENIADNGGLRAAWLAYKRRTSLSQENLRLPGLEEYNQDQLFFLAFANIWCSAFSARGIRSQVLTGAHAPGRYRVRGSLSNFPEFAQTFKCGVSSAMNPLQKCMLW